MQKKRRIWLGRAYDGSAFRSPSVRIAGGWWRKETKTDNAPGLFAATAPVEPLIDTCCGGRPRTHLSTVSAGVTRA